MLYTFMGMCVILSLQAPGIGTRANKNYENSLQTGDFFLTTAIRGREEEDGCLAFYCLFKANVSKGAFLWQKN